MSCKIQLDVDKLILKFRCNCTGPKTDKKKVLKKNNKVGKLTLLDFKTYYKATAVGSLDFCPNGASYHSTLGRRKVTNVKPLDNNTQLHIIKPPVLGCRLLAL